jgi:asparagine synthase (glutamine-hydrolysing)
LEVSSGIVVGQGGGSTFPSVSGRDPIDLLRERLRTFLAAPPCVVAFSGGRDSSALLALLVDEARREGLPEPLAVTARWDDDQASDESAWQEEVMSVIGASHWEIIRPGTDLDLLGEEATATLDGLGLLWPPPAYALLPMIRMARGGTFLSGEGGDEAFGLWPYGRLWSSVRNRSVPRQSDVRALLLGCSPRAVRRRRWQRNLPPYQTWLRPEAHRAMSLALADDQSDDPLRWDHYQVVSRRRRAVDLTVATLGRLCALESCTYWGPFLDEEFLASLAAWGGPFGRGDRTEVMSALFAQVLPSAILSRTTKASFAGVFWGPGSRLFAQEWDGSGLDDRLIDPVALRLAWLAPVPVYGAALPLHAAWIYRNRQTGTRPTAGPGTDP